MSPQEPLIGVHSLQKDRTFFSHGISIAESLLVCEIHLAANCRPSPSHQRQSGRKIYFILHVDSFICILFIHLFVFFIFHSKKVFSNNNDNNNNVHL